MKWVWIMNHLTKQSGITNHLTKHIGQCGWTCLIGMMNEKNCVCVCLYPLMMSAILGWWDQWCLALCTRLMGCLALECMSAVGTKQMYYLVPNVLGAWQRTYFSTSSMTVQCSRWQAVGMSTTIHHSLNHQNKWAHQTLLAPSISKKICHYL